MKSLVSINKNQPCLFPWLWKNNNKKQPVNSIYSPPPSATIQKNLKSKVLYFDFSRKEKEKFRENRDNNQAADNTDMD